MDQQQASVPQQGVPQEQNQQQMYAPQQGMPGEPTPDGQQPKKHALAEGRKQAFRVDTILASFVVALGTAFLIALAMLLLKSVSLPLLQLDRRLFSDVTIQILILFFLAFFVLIKGSTLAAWLLYRHDVQWGYKLEKKKVVPIFIIALVMATAIYSAVFMFATGELERLAYLGKPLDIIQFKE